MTSLAVVPTMPRGMAGKPDSEGLPGVAVGTEDDVDAGAAAAGMTTSMTPSCVMSGSSASAAMFVKIEFERSCVERPAASVKYVTVASTPDPFGPGVDEPIDEQENTM